MATLIANDMTTRLLFSFLLANGIFEFAGLVWNTGTCFNVKKEILHYIVFEL